MLKGFFVQVVLLLLLLGVLVLLISTELLTEK
jgi:hypothetical protein